MRTRGLRVDELRSGLGRQANVNVFDPGRFYSTLYTERLDVSSPRTLSHIMVEPSHGTSSCYTTHVIVTLRLHYKYDC
jgi:hypothetical protein